MIGFATPADAQQGAPETCLDTATTQTAMSRCAGEALKAEQQRLKQLLNELQDSLEAPQRAQLESAQRAWKAYATAECKFEASASEQGSMYPMQVSLCRRRLAEQRIRELAPLLCGPPAGGGKGCAAAEAYQARPRGGGGRR